MGWPTLIAGYFVVWWLVLFVVLPFGVRAAAEPDAKTGWRGVPMAPRFWRTILATSLLAALVWGGCVAVIESGLVSFRAGPFAMSDDGQKK